MAGLVPAIHVLCTAVKTWMRGSSPRMTRVAPALLAVLDRYQPDLVGQAIGGDRITVRRHIHVTDDVSAAGNCPALKFLGCRVETDDGVRLGAGLVVPERALGEDDAVGLRLRPARRFPFLYITGLEVETSEHAARIVGVPDGIVVGESETARPCGGVWQRVFLDCHGLRIDAGDLWRAELDEIGHAF